MSKEKLEELQEEINKVRKLYEQLKNDYSINKAFIDSNSDDSLKLLINNEINSYQEAKREIQERINKLSEAYNYLLNNDQSGKSRLTRIQEVTSDNIINDIKQKINNINNSYAEIFLSDKGNIPGDLLNKYEQIKNIHDDLIVVKNSENLNKVEDLNRKIDDFLSKYSEIIGNEENSKYKTFISNYTDFEKKKRELDDFYKIVFGSDDGNIQSLKKELEERKEQLKKVEEEAKKVIDLSSDAGLAAGFFKQVEQANDNKNKNLYFFAGAILCMAIFNFFTIDWKNLNNIDLVSAIVRLMINTPFIWAATVANINLNKYIKLEQEYAHKESLAKSFERYKDQIKDLSANYETDEKQVELMTKLLDTNIEAFKKNPSDNLEQIRVNNILIDEISKLFDKMKNKN
ncbi:hypothetical protein I9077_00725 [Campylobacter jejuni]|uniref:hypothetical protein n=1 Tax=Campylobacter novaezeelandiae TaxID=2267891 RepID=UPI001C1E7FA6|nr:hypothetical protein [Campylobacter novaezeelandiae]MBX0797369.1 hypothetical protein [Campylobacter jejuni]MBX0969550.1 hypothetical protein [Campylobacter jejuni]MBX1002311.1 hypothetical protein [Campylobacter jejuni]MBX1045976.1 hypothetical protein [Campylobacter jejuni]MBX1106396.1 hypothetical protein [Campylobacter jejuni]